MAPSSSIRPDVVVVGAGVVGLSAALALQARGLAVAVLDREGPAAGASAGNAGAFAFTDIFPLASPRIIRQAPRWLLDPLGPLAVPPRTGRMLGLGLQLPGGATIVASNAEVTATTDDSVRFGPGLGERTEVWLRSDRRVWASEVRRVGDLTVAFGPVTPTISAWPDSSSRQ